MTIAAIYWTNLALLRQNKGALEPPMGGLLRLTRSGAEAVCLSVAKVQPKTHLQLRNTTILCLVKEQ